MNQIDNRLRRCKWGWLHYSPSDQWIGQALDLYGEYSEIEVQTLLGLLPTGGVFVDAGANIGAITLPLARKASFGYAIEPQRLCFQALCANLAINKLPNVNAIHAGAGEREETALLMQPHWNGPNNLGGYSMTLGTTTEGAELTRIITLDGLQLARCDLIKADVEGMEAEVLRGARATIMRHRPVIYCEADRHPKTPALIALLHEFGYGTWWDVPPLFNPNNYAGNPDNQFADIVSINMLCLPDGREPASWGPDTLPELALPGDTFLIAQARARARDTKEVA